MCEAYMRPLALISPLLLFAPIAFAQAPEWQPDANGVWEIGFGPQPPHLIHSAPATLPASATHDPPQICYFSAVIGIDGTATQIRDVDTCPDLLLSAATTAIQQSRFEPGSRDGKPVPVRAAVWLPFGSDDFPPAPRMVHSAYHRGDPGVTPIRPISTPNAEYSDAARRARVQGVVVVAGIVTAEGTPINLHVMQHLGKGLDEQALKSVARWRFQPATRDGKPIPYALTTDVSFRLY
jgi:TonB family protein